MPAPVAVRQEGPLVALDAEEPALALGDAAARHVRLSARGLTAFRGGVPGAFVPWRQVRALSSEIPTTRWPNPAVADWIVPVVEGFLGGVGEVAETPTFPVHIVTTQGDMHEWPATVHYLAGYRRRDAAAANRLIDHLLAQPPSRALLAHPADLLDRLGRVLRFDRRRVT